MEYFRGIVRQILRGPIVVTTKLFDSVSKHVVYDNSIRILQADRSPLRHGLCALDYPPPQPFDTILDHIMCVLSHDPPWKICRLELYLPGEAL